MAALAPTGEFLIFSRVIQGIGGAMILPTTLSLINATFRGRERGIAFAVWGSTIGGMAAVGPLLGGWLTTDVLLALGVRHQRAARHPHRRRRAPLRDRVEGGAAARVDVVGAVLSVDRRSASLVFGLIEGRTYGWWLAADDLTIGDWTWPFDHLAHPHRLRHHPGGRRRVHLVGPPRGNGAARAR